MGRPVAFAGGEVNGLAERASACIDPALFPAAADNTPYLAPQVLTHVNHNMSVMTEESFGPVVGIVPVTNDEKAIHLMNDSDLGLTASLWTQDQARAEQLGEQRGLPGSCSGLDRSEEYRSGCSTFRVGLPSTHATQTISPEGCLGNRPGSHVQMKIGILNADAVKPEFAEEFGEYPDMFAEILLAVDPGLDLVTYEVVQGEYPAHLNEVDAYIITGSKFSVYDEVPWVLRLKEFVMEMHEAKKTLIGICFGHQMVAEALGGKTSAASAGWCVGVHRIIPTAHAASYGLPSGPINLRANHKDQVTQLPPGGKVLASTEACPIASMGLGEHILTFQAHPEFSEGYARALLTMRREIFGEKLYRAAIDSLETETDHLQVARHILNFISRQQQVRQN